MQFNHLSVSFMLLFGITTLISHLPTSEAYGKPPSVQFFMKSGKKGEDMILLGKPCSGIPTLLKTGKGKKQDLILLPNSCKTYSMPSYTPPSYGGGHGGGGGGHMSY